MVDQKRRRHSRRRQVGPSRAEMGALTPEQQAFETEMSTKGIRIPAGNVGTITTFDAAGQPIIVKKNVPVVVLDVSTTAGKPLLLDQPTP